MTTVTKLRSEDGTLKANLSVDGRTLAVTREFGAWGTEPDSEGRWREVLPRHAIALQERAKRFERKAE